MKMPKNIEKHFFAPCGVNCFVCYVHLKNNKPCNGCYGIDNNKPERCKKCTIKECVISKNLSYCFECSEFPCKPIKNLEKSYVSRYSVSILDNAKQVKLIGIDAFYNAEINKWKCASCGGVITQHGNYCSECKDKEGI